MEVAAYNAFVTTEFAHKKSTGQTPRDYLAFRMSLGEELIGSFSTRQRAGCPRSLEHQHDLRLNTSRSHLPVIVGLKRDCVVCVQYRKVKKLASSQYRHESAIQCSTCKVHLYVASGRPCFEKYHTLVRYWE